MTGRERRAYGCQAKDCVHRIFLTPGEPETGVPSCHGRKMVRLPNLPYRKPEVKK